MPHHVFKNNESTANPMIRRRSGSSKQAMGRRKFLKFSGLCAAGLAFPNLPMRALAGVAEPTLKAKSLPSVDYASFLSRQDMKWDKIPTNHMEAPYLGNGMLGLMIYRENANKWNSEATNEKNVLSLHLGRSDYYDNRPPVNGNPHTWVYRGRLPIGFFRIRSKGDVTGVAWRLDLWNAKLVGMVKTTVGSYRIEGLVQSLYDSFYWKVIPSSSENVRFEMQPQEAFSSTRRISEQAIAREKAGGPPASHFHLSFADCPYPKAPEYQAVKESGWNYCRQILYADSGELITAWVVKDDKSDRSRTLLGTIAFSKRLGVSHPTAKANLQRALREVETGMYLSAHQNWWHAYYARSFVSLSDDYWEQFYWIQIYKLASATRSHGPVLDVMGPWYCDNCFHPLIWTDLDVELDYWAPLTANRLGVGTSLANQLDRYSINLINNVPPDWRDDCLNAGTVFPADMDAPVGKIVSDHIVWMLHDYWLH